MKYLSLTILGLTILTAPGWAKEFPSSSPASLTGLNFAQPYREKQLVAFRKFAQERSAGWSHFPVSTRGQSITEYWVGGPYHEDFHRGIAHEEAGSTWFEWQILFYRVPQVFGLKLEAGRNPERDGWGVSLTFGREGSPYFKDVNELVFRKFSAGKLVDKFDLASPGVKLPEGFQPDEITARGSTFSALASSDANFRSEGDAILERLDASLQAHLKEHAIRRIVPTNRPFRRGQDSNDYATLTPAEEKIILTKTKQVLEQRRSALHEHYREFRKAFLDLAPAEIWSP